jgi:hypothetical protein
MSVVSVVQVGRLVRSKSSASIYTAGSALSLRLVTCGSGLGLPGGARVSVAPIIMAAALTQNARSYPAVGEDAPAAMVAMAARPIGPAKLAAGVEQPGREPGLV